jgi:fructose-1-phosphate kinase PfkB-like protein
VRIGFTRKGIVQWPIPLISVISKIGAGDVLCPIAANLLLQTISRKDALSDTVATAQTEEAGKT